MTDIEQRLEAWAEKAPIPANHILDYIDDTDETISPHLLLTSIRRVEDAALHFQAPNTEWVVTASVDTNGIARYTYYEYTGAGDVHAETRSAIELEDLLHRCQPEIVPVDDTPLQEATI